MNLFSTILIIYFIFFACPDFSLADSLELKSGKIIEGQIVEQNSDTVKIDAGVGVAVTYYRDEIEKVNGEPFSAAATSEQNVVEDSLPVPAPVETVETEEEQVPLPAASEPVAEIPAQENLSEKDIGPSASPQPVFNSEQPVLELKPDAPIPVEEEFAPVAEEVPAPQPVVPPPLTNPEAVETPPETTEAPAPVISHSKQSSDLDKYFPKEMRFFAEIMGGIFQPHGPEKIIAKFFLVYLLIMAILAVGFIIYAAALFRIGVRLSDPSPSHAFVPVIQWFLLIRLVKWPAVTVILMFIPLVGDIVQMFAWMKISRNLNRSEWWGILMPVWFLNLIVIWMLALSPAPQKVEKISPEDLKT